MPEANPQTHKRRHFSQKVQGISASGIRHFFELIANMDGCISLGVGEPDFVTPERFSRAAFNAVLAGETHYTSNYGLAGAAGRPFPSTWSASTACATTRGTRSWSRSACRRR